MSLQRSGRSIRQWSGTDLQALRHCDRLSEATGRSPKPPRLPASGSRMVSEFCLISSEPISGIHFAGSTGSWSPIRRTLNRRRVLPGASWKLCRTRRRDARLERH